MMGFAGIADAARLDKASEGAVGRTGIEPWEDKHGTIYPA
jgi:hypothetical protein